MDRRAVDARVIAEFRAGGAVSGMHRERLLLLTTTGRRSGQPRTAPMMFVLDGNDPVVIGSDQGAAHDPAWVLNLRADPNVTVELPDGRGGPARASVLTGDERERVWADLIRAYPFFLNHQAATSRPIPLVRLRLE
jgi:deazaflavin-dependent oxidoreductase (nitroreductase family)